MKTQRALASLLAVLQLVWSFSFGAFEVLAQNVAAVQAVPQTLAPAVGFFPMAGGNLMPGANPTLGFNTLSLTPSLPSAPGVLPMLRAAPNAVVGSVSQAGARTLTHPSVQNSPALRTPAAPSPQTQRLSAMPTVEAKALAVQAAPGAAQAARMPAATRNRLSDSSRNSGAAELGKAQNRVGEALELKGLGAKAGAESSKGAAEDVFSALRGEQTLPGSQTVVPSAASALRRIFRLKASEAPAPEVRSSVPTPAEVQAPATPAKSGLGAFVRGTSFKIGSGIVGATVLAAAAPWLLANPAFVGAAGSVLLGGIGIPQIVKNFREGSKAVKDIPIGWPMMWFVASVLFSAVSIGQGASIWWNSVNVAGVLESGTVLAQINYHRRDRAEMRASLLTVLGALAPLPLMAMQVFMPLTSWLQLALTGAIYLCWVMNWPQIKAYNSAFRKDGSRPEGLTPYTPALVAVGSLLHLYAALMSGNLNWAMNAIVAILGTGIVVAQYYFPRAANVLVTPAAKLVDGVSSALRRGWLALKKAYYLPKARKALAQVLDPAELQRFAGPDAKTQIDAMLVKVRDLPGRSAIVLEAPTSAGKSTLAKSIEELLGSRFRPWELDSYFVDGSDIARDAQGQPDWDTPLALNLDKIAEHAGTLLRGGSIELPSRDMTLERTVFETGKFMQLGPDELLALDSIFASHPKILEALKGHPVLNLYLDAPAIVRLTRRLLRDKVSRGVSYESTLKRWGSILDHEKEFIYPTRSAADMILNLVNEKELRGLPEALAGILAEDWAEHGRRSEFTGSLLDMLRASLAADESGRAGAETAGRAPAADPALARLLPADPTRISAEQAGRILRELGLTQEELARRLLPVARGLASPALYGKAHGAVAVGRSGALYLGGNIELTAGGVEINIHAEQAAVTRALQSGETELSLLAITAPPCGACRSFLNELASRDKVRILVEGVEAELSLKELYPMPYGDDGSLLSRRDNALTLQGRAARDPLAQAALAAANAAYVRRDPAGIALRTQDGRVYTGSLVDVRGHVSVLTPLETALVALAADGKTLADVTEAVLAGTRTVKGAPAQRIRAVLSKTSGVRLRVVEAAARQATGPTAR